MIGVKQKDPLGCGIAAVATVAGMTYDEVCAVWIAKCGGHMNRLRTIPQSDVAPRGLNHLEVEALLVAVGARADVRMTFGPIIRLTTQSQGGPGHWIVIDGTGAVHNPA